MTRTNRPGNEGRGHGMRPRVPALGWRMTVALALAFAFVLADQLVKLWVRSVAADHGFPISVIPGVVDFDFVMNTGVAFGLAEGFGYSFVVLAVAVIIASFAYLLRAPLVSRLEVIGLGMVCGGAIGNAIDRVVHGYVTDFIATTFISFPVFNIADIGITVGVVLALVGFLVLSPANDAARRKAEEDRAERLGHQGAGASRRPEDR